MNLLASLIVLLFFSFSFVLGHGSKFSIKRSISEISVHFGEQKERGVGDFGLEKRQACGAGVGPCPAGQCCSSAGQCGTGPNFCTGPDCQLPYGPACDGNVVPPGSSTLGITRSLVGSIPYGSIITQCTTPGTVALTFDDGPYLYTQSVLETLAKYNNTHATFFITGNNLGKGRIDDPSLPWAQLLQSMHKAGHHIASHTWSHQDLTQISTDLRQNQIIYNEMAFRNIFGWVPTYIRPPYGFCDGGCVSYLNSLGYHIVTWNLDTKDYENDDPSLIHISQGYFAGNLSNESIELSHDVHQQTALVLVSYMLDTVAQRGFKAVSVAECLGDPPANWYRDAGGIPSTSSSISSTSSASPTASTGSYASNTATRKIIITSTTASATATSSANLAISTTSKNTSSSTTSAATTTKSPSEGTGLRVHAWLYGLLFAASLVAICF